MGRENLTNEGQLALITKEKLRKWSHLHNLEGILNAINYNIDFMILGPPGSGKSELVKDISGLTNTQPRYVNFSQ
jgi:ABC-type polar amino acid transport system ATPase subunit